jgi:DME family drug/metabolite transporter
MHHRISFRRALMYVVLAGLAWGTGGPTGALLSRHADLSPLATSFWRLSAAAIWLALARRVVRSGPIRPRLAAAPLRYVLSGIGLAVCQLGYFAAIPRVGIGVATVIALGAGPIFITLATRERLTAAVPVAIGGLTLLTLDTGSANLTGVAAALLSAAGYATTTVLNRNDPDPLTSAYLGFAAGALLLTPFATFPSTTTGWLLIAYFGLIPTAVAYTLFYAALNTLKASTASVVALLEPLVATAIGTLAFHEHLTPATLLGGALLLLAITAQSRHH